MGVGEPGPGAIVEPADKRAVAFIDGQNLYRHAKAAFGHHYPNYDPIRLHNAVCAAKGWNPFGVRFYTGVPASNKDQLWHNFWSHRLLAMTRAGILVTRRTLRYHEQKIELPAGTDLTDQDGYPRTAVTAEGTFLADTYGNPIRVETPQEKGVDVRLALDVIRLALSNQYDVAVIYSQDQDLAEVVSDVIEIARVQQRWIKLACAFPTGANATARRGIDKTEWIPMDQVFYDACLDPHDYR